MPKAWNLLVSSLLNLPGVGPKMAERMALHLLRHDPDSDDLLQRLEEARRKLRRCSQCGDFVESDAPVPTCPLCRDTDREDSLLCVVEEIGDLQAMERSRAFRGRYHVLGGVLSALDGVGPEELRIHELLQRIRSGKITEVILATNPTAEGETTAAYLADLLKPLGVQTTRLAYGLSSGSAIQYADEFTLARALEGRRPLS
ncbi:MAG TPA: recombination mediator RecR [Elusimicrobiota bacterium]|nr:recombination mediator RecR [Elusimicrobiota bacterium]